MEQLALNFGYTLPPENHLTAVQSVPCFPLETKFLKVTPQSELLYHQEAAMPGTRWSSTNTKKMENHQPTLRSHESREVDILTFGQLTVVQVFLKKRLITPPTLFFMF